MTSSDFESLLVEGESVPVAGWDFSWFAGRATEERPSWGYAGLVRERMARAQAVLDIQTGGGEVLAAAVTVPPPVLRATEGWPPNAAIARSVLAPFGGIVVDAAEDDPLPFPAESFDLVVSRHPTTVLWAEISRVLRPGGQYLSQQIGTGSNKLLYEFFLGVQPEAGRTGAELAPERAAAVGLTTTNVRAESLRLEFYDVAAVIVFLRKVIWTVPDFTVDRYRDRLRDLHEHIQRNGRFVSYAQRVLVEAVKPAD